MTTQQRELDLVEKVDFRILNVANNEAKLHELLQKFLVPLLLKGASEHPAVRAKVVSVAQRLKLYIQAPGVVLPVAALVQQLKTTESGVVRHLDLVFIQHSIGRLTPKERRDVLPSLFEGIANVNTTTPALVDIILQTLAVLRLPPRGSTEDDAFAKEMGLASDDDAAYIADRFGKVFLLSRAGNPMLSPADVTFFGFYFAQDNGWLRTGTNLSETRIRVANFLASGVFSSEARLKMRFMPALYAAAHTDGRVASIGADLLKRTAVSLEDRGLVDQLFGAHAVLPPAYRTRILGLLSRSVLAASYDDEILQVVRLNMGVDEADDATTSRSRGLETAKLHRALFEFINWIARVATGGAGDKAKTLSIGRPLVEYMQQYIVGLGWPTPTSAGVDAEPLRAKAYETLGTLAKGANMPVADKLALAAWLFRSLTEDPTAEVVVNVDGALSSLAGAFAPGTADTELQQLLLQYMSVDEESPETPHIRRSARHAAAKWANVCLSAADPVARWIDIVAAAGRRGERSDVVEEGHKGLDPWTHFSADLDNTKRKVVLPDWQALVHTFFQSRVASGDGAMDVDGPLSNFAGERMDAFALAVNYCRRILLLTALRGHFKVEPGWEQQLETLVDGDKPTRTLLKSYFHEHDVQGLLSVAFAGMLSEHAGTSEPSGRAFVQLASLAPQASLASLVARVGELLLLSKSNTKELRGLAASAIGILAAHPVHADGNVSKLQQSLAETAKAWPTAVGSELNAVEGAYLALSRLVSRLTMYGRSSAYDMGALFPATDKMSGLSPSFRNTLFDALTQLWTAGLPVLPGLSRDADADRTMEATKAVVEVLVVEAKKGNERAITGLGRLALAVGGGAEPGAYDVVDDILTRLYALHELRQAEVHFAIGGALSAAVACWDSEIVELSLDVDSTADAFKTARRAERLAAVLDKILADCKKTKPSLLKASGIWLFSLIQHSSHLPEIQSRLRACQGAFMRLLSARDELVQETASRGLGLVYSKGDDADLKKDLVRDLVSAFTGSGPQLKVDDETELFEAGALPTGDRAESSNKSVTSYRDIVNLANEVGDQTLIYKFMSLAANAATWSTRSAFGRFGLGNILGDADAETAVDPKLYPKLFRYRFDPNPNVQRSMEDIWKALVKEKERDAGATVDLHFDAIITDLLASILGKEWRVREACCAALADLVQGRPFAQYAKYYKEVWARALKVLDDVKGSVREAALRLCITLSNLLVRQLEQADANDSKNSKDMMDEALAFLLSDKGIESGVKDVQVFATVTVLKIAKHGGRALRPHIAAMVTHLLGLLSTIEPEAFNYYYNRSGDEGKERLDKMRSAMVSQSPISEAIENALRSVDAPTLAALAPGIEGVMKTAVGMPTKIGCARVLTTLATRHTLDFKESAPRFLVVLGKYALGDVNDEVSQSYAKAAAYVLRAAPDAAQQKYATRLIEAYFGAEDEAKRQKVADAVLALSKMSPDHFMALEGVLLPWVFLGMHDFSETSDYVKAACKDVWERHAGSTGMAVALHVGAIAGLVQRALDTAQWALKHAGARASAAATDAILKASTVSGSLNEPALRALWPLYEKSLALKTFDGKEVLLKTLPDFVAKAKPLWTQDAKMATSLKKIALVEAKRNNAAYRVHAFVCLGQVAAARDDVDLWPDVVAIAGPYVHEYAEDKMDVDDDAKDGDKKNVVAENRARVTAENALTAIATGYFRPAMASTPTKVLANVWAAVGASVLSDAFLLSRRSVWYKVAGELFDAAAAAAAPSTESPDSDSLVADFLTSLDTDKPDAGTEEQRTFRAKALKNLAKAAKHLSLAGREKVKAAAEGALAVERSLDVQKILREAVAEGR